MNVLIYISKYLLDYALSSHISFVKIGLVLVVLEGVGIEAEFPAILAKNTTLSNTTNTSPILTNNI
jgi:hypothetical protein